MTLTHSERERNWLNAAWSPKFPQGLKNSSRVFDVQVFGSMKRGHVDVYVSERGTGNVYSDSFPSDAKTWLMISTLADGSRCGLVIDASAHDARATIEEEERIAQRTAETASRLAYRYDTADRHTVGAALSMKWGTWLLLGIAVACVAALDIGFRVGLIK